MITQSTSPFAFPSIELLRGVPLCGDDESHTGNEIATLACRNTRLRNQPQRSQALRRLGTPFWLATTILEEGDLDYFILPLIILFIFSQQKDPSG
jgi:hypothetical protein